MFTRRQTYEQVRANGTTFAYDLEPHSRSFPTDPGVHFLIHVIHEQTVNVTTPGGPGTQAVVTPRTFLKPVPLAEKESATNLLGVKPSAHPDQLYLNKIPDLVLTDVKSKTVVRVEIDDSMELCDKATFGSCSEVIPAWCKKHFPGVPAFIFVHRSDRRTQTPRYAYDLGPNREDYHEEWQWGDVLPSDALAHRPAPKPLVIYVAEIRCDSIKCAKKKNRGTHLLPVDSLSAGEKKIATESGEKDVPGVLHRNRVVVGREAA